MSNDDRRDEQFSASERALIDRLRESPAESASPEARERARRAFLEGEGATLELRPRLTTYQRWGGVLAAAAVLFFVVMMYGMQPTSTWRVTDVVNPDGVAGVTAVDGELLGAEIPAGRVATGPGSELELQLGQDVRIRLIPGSEVELPPGPGRWFGRERSLRIHAGELYGTSRGTNGSEELGWRLTLAGRDAEALLTGTTFALFLLEEATCFCLFEGGLQVQVAATGERIDLPVGQRIWVYPDGRTEMRPLDGMETMKLEMSRDRGIQ